MIYYCRQYQLELSSMKQVGRQQQARKHGEFHKRAYLCFHFHVSLVYLPLNKSLNIVLKYNNNNRRRKCFQLMRRIVPQKLFFHLRLLTRARAPVNRGRRSLPGRPSTSPIAARLNARVSIFARFHTNVIRKLNDNFILLMANWLLFIFSSHLLVSGQLVSILVMYVWRLYKDKDAYSSLFDRLHKKREVST